MSTLLFIFSKICFMKGFPMMITICFSDSTRRWDSIFLWSRENWLSHSNIYYSYYSSSVDEFFYTRVKINMMNLCNESIKVLSNQSLCILSDFPRVDLHKMSFLCCLLIEIILDPMDPLTSEWSHHLVSGAISRILSRTYQKKALHTFEICWKHQWLEENKIANTLLKNCLKEWNQRLLTRITVGRMICRRQCKPSFWQNSNSRRYHLQPFRYTSCSIV